VRRADAGGLTSWSASRSLGVSFAVTISATKLTTRRGHYLKVTLKARPAVQASRRSVRLEVYSGGHWVLSRYVRLSSAGNATFYQRRSTRGSRKIRLRLTGGKGYGTGTSGTLTLHWT
jgi:hypothetical protein